jgi:hypothetical protein
MTNAAWEKNRFKKKLSPAMTNAAWKKNRSKKKLSLATIKDHTKYSSRAKQIFGGAPYYLRQLKIEVVDSVD